METGAVEIDGFQLRWRSEGTGLPALVVGSSVYYPRVFAAGLRQRLRLIFIDHRGFGMPPRDRTLDTSDFSLEVLIEDIERMRQALGLERMIIIGHSGHGYLALEYTKKYPQHVSHVVLLALSPNSSPEAFQAADRYLAESVCPERKAILEKSLQQLPADIEAAPQRRFIAYSLRSAARIWYDYSFDAAHLWEGVEVVPEVFDHVWGKIFRQLDITPGLEKLVQPVFLGLGRYDYWNPPHLWEPMRGNFRNLRIRVFEKSGHTPQYEEPELFEAELMRWLAETGT